MSDDLVARLRHAWDERERQLDEDERVALAAITTIGIQALDTWSYEPGAEARHGGKIKDAMGYTVVHQEDSTPDPSEAQHIARHDPARVLAEVERARRDIAAKRHILDEIMGYEAKIDGEWGCCHGADAIEAGECPETRPDEIAGVRLLAEAEGLT
jgi:hypothetical protein